MAAIRKARTLLFLALFPLPLPAQNEADTLPPRHVFEGVVEFSDPALAPQVRSGEVFSGSFFLDPYGIAEPQPVPGRPEERYEGVLASLEFTFDVNFIIRYEGGAREGPNWALVLNNDPDHDGRDFIGLLFAITGQPAGRQEWTPSWLELWFFDPSGDMLRDQRLPRENFSFQRGWFRMTFTHPEHDLDAIAEGTIDMFGLETEPPNLAQEVNLLEEAVRTLDGQLKKQAVEIERLNAELEAAGERVKRLTQTIDTLIGERAVLQEELSNVQKQAARADPGIVSKMAELQAEKAMIELEREQLKGKNTELAEALARSELERQQIRQDLIRFQEQAEALAAAQQATLSPTPATAQEAGFDPAPPVAKIQPEPVLPQERPARGTPSSDQPQGPVLQTFEVVEIPDEPVPADNDDSPEPLQVPIESRSNEPRLSAPMERDAETTTPEPETSQPRRRFSGGRRFSSR